mmetsp:Transcript_45643/g.117967  ORF Transcript_45643/g.117967 Transcript_45643/m.117967 type:complete len:637 (-) Transcript_45643:64-1974(-)
MDGSLPPSMSTAQLVHLLVGDSSDRDATLASAARTREGACVQREEGSEMGSSVTESEGKEVDAESSYGSDFESESESGSDGYRSEEEPEAAFEPGVTGTEARSGQEREVDGRNAVEVQNETMESTSITTTASSRDGRLLNSIGGVIDELSEGSDGDHDEEVESPAQRLRSASEEGEAEKVLACLRDGADVNERSRAGQNAIELACQYGHSHLIPVLVEAGANPNEVDERHGASCMHLAVLGRHERTVEQLLDLDLSQLGAAMSCTTGGLEGRENDENDGEGKIKELEYESPLETAQPLAVSSPPSVESEPAGPSSISSFPSLPLLSASGIKESSLCISSGSHVVVEHDMFASEESSTQSVSSINIEVRDREGFTPLCFASLVGSSTIAELLLLHDADVNATSYKGGSPLSVAASHGHTDVVKLLLLHGADLQHKDDSGLTVLSHAAMEGHKDVVELLLNEILTRKKEELAPKVPPSLCQSSAREGGSSTDAKESKLSVSMLLEAKNKSGNTALMLAAWFSPSLAVLSYLLRAGADTECVNNLGKTALDLAMSARVKSKEKVKLIRMYTISTSFLCLFEESRTFRSLLTNRTDIGNDVVEEVNCAPQPLPLFKCLDDDSLTNVLQALIWCGYNNKQQ